MPYNIIIGRNSSEKEKFKDSGLIYIGKGYVKMGNYNSLSNKIYLDVAKNHVILVAGKRGSGKSYTLGVLTEEISNLPKEISQNIGSLIFDTMGIYWTMKYKNEKDKTLLEEWDLQTKNLPVKIFVPFGHYESYKQKKIPIDNTFALDIKEMSAQDWILTFNLKITEPTSVLIQKTISKLSQEKEYDIDDIIQDISQDKISSKEDKNSCISLFQAAKTWGIFSTKNSQKTQVSDLITGGITSILDLSVYNSVGIFNIRALVISLISRKIFNQRMDQRKKEEMKSLTKSIDLLEESEKKEYPLVWLFIDEAHEFLPKNEKTLATDALIQLLREGRQPGISLVLATQQPGQIHHDVMTQSDIIISHKVTSSQDIEALNQIMQTYVLEGIKKQMNNLPPLKGSAIILDDNSERIYPIRIRPRFTWHGGEAPQAIIQKKEI